MGAQADVVEHGIGRLAANKGDGLLWLGWNWLFGGRLIVPSARSPRLTIVLVVG
jgi:hypothetical protein